MNKDDRPNWHQTWMTIAFEIAERSYSPRLHVGAIIVPEDNTGILALGYNGNASGLPNEPASDEPGADEFLHAELNACLKLDYHNPAIKIMYVTHLPCSACSKIAIQSRIRRVVYQEDYRIKDGIEILRQGGVEVYRYDPHTHYCLPVANATKTW